MAGEGRAARIGDAVVDDCFHAATMNLSSARRYPVIDRRAIVNIAYYARLEARGATAGCGKARFISCGPRRNVSIFGANWRAKSRGAARDACTCRRARNAVIRIGSASCRPCRDRDQCCISAITPKTSPPSEVRPPLRRAGHRLSCDLFRKTDRS
jgi:hypothetical protein